MKPLKKSYISRKEIEANAMRFRQQWKQDKLKSVLGHEADLATLDKIVMNMIIDSETSEVYLNDTYQVFMIRHESLGMFELSIRRLDRKPIHDWRDLQEIKNQLVGPDNEGIELYPAESRKVDTANQYYLWVVMDPKFRFPFGFSTRSVSEGSLGKSVNRPFEKDSK